MFRVTTEIRPYIDALNKIPGGMQVVTARTLTELADLANRVQVVNTKARLKVRTKYTTNSMRIYKASEARPIASQNAVVGTISPYMGFQNEGGRTQSTTGGRMPVPTNAVRGADRMKHIPKALFADAMGDLGADGNKFFQLDPTGKAVMDPKNNHMGFAGKRQKGQRRKKELIFGRKRGKKVIAYKLKMGAIFWRKSKRKLVKVRNLKDTGYEIKGVKFHDDAVRRVWTQSNVARVYLKHARVVAFRPSK